MYLSLCGVKRKTFQGRSYGNLRSHLQFSVPFNHDNLRRTLLQCHGLGPSSTGSRLSSPCPRFVGPSTDGRRHSSSLSPPPTPDPAVHLSLPLRPPVSERLLKPQRGDQKVTGKHFISSTYLISGSGEDRVLGRLHRIHIGRRYPSRVWGRGGLKSLVLDTASEPSQTNL